MKKNWYKGITATAITLAMAGAALTVPAMAIDYDLNYGDVYVGEDETGVWSGQTNNPDEGYFYYVKSEDSYYYVEGKYYHKDGGDNTVNISQGTIPNSNDSTDTNSPTDNAVNISGNTSGLDITIDKVNVDTDDTFLTVEEGTTADITISNSDIVTDQNGIEIGKHAEDSEKTDPYEKTDVDITLNNTDISLDTVGNVAGIYQHDNSSVDLTLEGSNTITADDEAIKEYISDGNTANKNINGICVGGDVADSSVGDATLNIYGTEDGTGSLDIANAGNGIVVKNESSLTVTDNAQVTIEDTVTVTSSGAGRGINQYGDLTISDGAWVNIDGVYQGKVTVDNDLDGWTSSNYGYGIDSYKEINIDGGSLSIDTTENGIYLHADSAVNVTNDGSLTISEAQKNGIQLENNAEGIFVDDATLNINNSGTGIYATGGKTNIEFTNGAQVNISNLSGNAIGSDGNNATGHILVDGKNEEGTYTQFVSQNINSTAFATNFAHITVSNGATMAIDNANDGITLGACSTDANESGAANLYVTSGGQLIMTNIDGDAIGTAKNEHKIEVTNKGKIETSGTGNGIKIDHNDLYILVNDGTLNLKNDVAGIFVSSEKIGNYLDEQANSHIEATNGIYGADEYAGMTVQVMGGTLTYNFSKPYTFWPVNDKLQKLTNFILTADDEHADFYACTDQGQYEYQYQSDLKKENGTLSVWVPAADIQYLVDTDAIDDDLLNEILAQLLANGYNFDYKYPDDILVTDKVVNGHSLNFTMNNGKLVWADYANPYEGAAVAHDLVYGTTLTVDGEEYNINWYIPDNAGVLQAFTTATNVIGGTDGMVTVYGALATQPEEPEPPVEPDPPYIPDYPDYPDIPDYDPPEEDIDDDDVPLVDTPVDSGDSEGPSEVIEDEDTPLAPSIPDEEVDEIIAEIEHEVTPLASVPQTGAEIPAATAALPAGVLTLAVSALVRRLRRKD